jgi:PiT family inorganic phosphate transporter
LAVLLLVAFSNGTNDVSKGVATLVGSGLASYRRALIWGSLWTVAGGIAAFFVASAVLKVFSTGILAADVELSVSFSLAVGTAVFLWIFFASHFGVPVSTTHSIVGAVCGPILLTLGPSKILWPSLGYKIILPLMLSPFLALLFSASVYKTGFRLLKKLSNYCLCFGPARISSCASAGGQPATAFYKTDAMTVKAGGVDRCESEFDVPMVLHLNDIAHWLSSALISFARGMNDTPKIVAIIFTSAAFMDTDSRPFFFLVVVAMGLGGYLRGAKVTKTLSEKITAMDRNDSIIANLSTSLLVVFASKFGLPVSTTHVSSCSIIGIGLKRDARAINRGVILEMLFAWGVTLPVAGVLSAAVYIISKNLFGL